MMRQRSDAKRLLVAATNIVKLPINYQAVQSALYSAIFIVNNITSQRYCFFQLFTIIYMLNFYDIFATFCTGAIFCGREVSRRRDGQENRRTEEIRILF